MIKYGLVQNYSLIVKYFKTFLNAPSPRIFSISFFFSTLFFMKAVFNSQCYRSSTDGEMICLIVEVPQFIMIIIDGEPEETPKIFN